MSLMQEIREIPQTKAALKNFGLTLGIFFSLIGAWLTWRGKPHAIYFVGAGGVFLFFGLLLPALLAPVQKAWMTLALLMGWVMSRVILTVLFYLVFTPVGFVLRLMGKDLLDVRRGAAQPSYWKTRAQRAKADYENQF